MLLPCYWDFTVYNCKIVTIFYILKFKQEKQNFTQHHVKAPGQNGPIKCKTVYKTIFILLKSYLQIEVSVLLTM